MIAPLSVTNIGRCLTRRREIGWEKKWRQAFCSKTAKLRMWKGENCEKFRKQINTFSSCLCSVSHPFLGDYVRLRQNVQWKKICVENNDQYVVFADIINKIARSSGKVGKWFAWPRKLFKWKSIFNSLFLFCWSCQHRRCCFSIKERCKLSTACQLPKFTECRWVLT